MPTGDIFPQSHRSIIMRRTVIAAALLGASLTAISSIEAKTIWLKCSYFQINLDSEKERFSLSNSKDTYQGPAMFSPGQINFEYQSFGDPSGGGIKELWAINRKSLRYTHSVSNRVILSSSFDTGWKPSSSESGQCSIMKTPPTAGNKI